MRNTREGVTNVTLSALRMTSNNRCIVIFESSCTAAIINISHIGSLNSYDYDFAVIPSVSQLFQNSFRDLYGDGPNA